jgi:hypothetical protein
MESRRRVEENSELQSVRKGRPITHASIKKLGEDLQLSMERFLPRISAPHKKVTCLLIAWAHAYKQDNNGVRQDFDEFRDLMLEHYHFKVDEYLIDRTKTQRTLEREMTSDARIKGLQSFTQAFCQTIRADPNPATVAQIHARLLSQWQDENKGNYLQTTPVHKAAASFDKPSIILAPSNVPRATGARPIRHGQGPNYGELRRYNPA